ncbi:RagB/SusD family nutrient uptake outer membrane protein [Sphingobacterium bovistauri]|uniref:RagB/SusD family nutrient uptake outer membrane protein n=1 Tax=Sphingobacterium bovistauri TaxID=2781959 RepID=A0ABS7Z885_9SPHI|nr:RagB/SusD family nutrient uptake outer membrane protein [Sphingobacterium bovistauri]MCA5006198.1 RagB/SusD family nutrient uptake outer membrane protein [Sphingobacterium bovistauri]
MKNKLLFIICILFVSINTGCEKILDHQPDDRTELNSQEKVSELLANAYPKGSYITMAESMSDLAGDKGNNGKTFVNQFAWMFKDQLDPSDTDSPPFYWNACYNAIAAANYALEALSKLEETSATRADRGEALVARAYSHFMLVTFFAKSYDPQTASTDLGIPYVIDPQKVVEGSYSRGTVKSVYDNIEKDLLEGISLISDQKYTVPKYHFNTKAAYAFATRFYLFKQEYQKVIEFANKVYTTEAIGNNLRAWNTVYSGFGYYELEAIYTNSTEPANLLLQEAKTSWGRNYAGYTYALSESVLQKVFLSNSNPARKTFAQANKIFGGTELVYNLPKFREHFVKPSISANFGDAYNMIPLFTTEEVLFNRAEAHASLGNNAACIADLDVYLSKRLVSYSAVNDKFSEQKATAFFTGKTSSQALIESILNFKKIEYIHEGMRWFDILRHKIAFEHISADGKINISISADDNRKVLQIPENAIAIGLEANPR